MGIRSDSGVSFTRPKHELPWRGGVISVGVGRFKIARKIAELEEMLLKELEKLLRYGKECRCIEPVGYPHVDGDGIAVSCLQCGGRLELNTDCEYFENGRCAKEEPVSPEGGVFGGGERA